MRGPRAHTADGGGVRDSRHIDRPGRRKRLREHIRAQQKARESGELDLRHQTVRTAEPVQSLAATQERLERQIEVTDHLDRQMRNMMSEMNSLKRRVIAAERRCESLETASSSIPPPPASSPSPRITWMNSGGASAAPSSPPKPGASPRTTWTQRLINSGPTLNLTSPRLRYLQADAASPRRARLFGTGGGAS